MLSLLVVLLGSTNFTSRPAVLLTPTIPIDTNDLLTTFELLRENKKCALFFLAKGRNHRKVIWRCNIPWQNIQCTIKYDMFDTLWFVHSVETVSVSSKTRMKGSNPFNKNKAFFLFKKKDPNRHENKSVQMVCYFFSHRKRKPCSIRSSLFCAALQLFWKECDQKKRMAEKKVKKRRNRVLFFCKKKKTSVQSNYEPLNRNSDCIG